MQAYGTDGAGGGDVQIGNEARQRILQELEQVRSWANRLQQDNTEMRAILASNTPQMYKRDYDFGTQLVTDLESLCGDIDEIKSEVDNMISTTEVYVQEQAEYNAV